MNIKDFTRGLLTPGTFEYKVFKQICYNADWIGESGPASVGFTGKNIDIEKEDPNPKMPFIQDQPYIFDYDGWLVEMDPDTIKSIGLVIQKIKQGQSIYDAVTEHFEYVDRMCEAVHNLDDLTKNLLMAYKNIFNTDSPPESLVEMYKDLRTFVDFEQSPRNFLITNIIGLSHRVESLKANINHAIERGEL